MTCSAECKVGEYQLPGEKKCGRCPTNCQSCSDSSTCSKCLDKFYVSSGACLDCPAQCGACSSSTECLSCSDGGHFLGTDKLTCSTDCNPNEYKEVNEKKCKPCSTSNCAVCSQSDVCTTCENGFFDNSGACDACPTLCGTCKSPSECLTCKDSANFLGTDQVTCSENCLGDQRKIITEKRCSRCETTCEVCEPNEDCQKCQKGYFKNNQKGCSKCPSQCSDCTSATECQACQDPLDYLWQDSITCSKECQTREFKDQSTKKCKNCLDGNCSVCDGAGSCTDCDQEFFLSSGSCIQCPSQCSGCVSGTECTGCQDSSLLLATDRLTCSQTCQDKEFEDREAMRCSTCPANCARCSEAGACLECVKKAFRDKETNQCEACPPQCGECSSSLQCKYCENPLHFLNPDDLSCSPICGPRLYPDENSPRRCLYCPDLCDACSRAGGCTNCRAPHLSDGKGGCVFIGCSVGCEECAPNSICSNCQRGRFRLEDGRTCAAECPEGWFGDDLKRKCEKCPSGCSGCSGGGRCSGCLEGLELAPEGLCKLPFELNYVLLQVYDPYENDADFVVQILVVDAESIPGASYQEIEANLIGSGANSVQNGQKNSKIQNFFEVKNPALEGKGEGQEGQGEAAMIKYSISKSEKDYIFQMKIFLPENQSQPKTAPTTPKNTKDTLTLQIASFRTPLTTHETNKNSIFYLKQKSKKMSLKVYKKSSEQSLGATLTSLSERAKAASSLSEPVTIGLGASMILFSSDPSGRFMRFNQYINLLKRIRLLSGFLGVSLETWIENLSSSEGQKTVQKAQKSTKRALFVSSLGVDRVTEIKAASNGSKGKFDRYGISIFVEGMFLAKIAIFDISWILKIISFFLLEGMKRRLKVSKWKIFFWFINEKFTLLFFSL